MPLLELIILRAKLHRRIAYTYLDQVSGASLSTLRQLLVTVCFAGGRATQSRVVVELALEHVWASLRLLLRSLIVVLWGGHGGLFELILMVLRGILLLVIVVTKHRLRHILKIIIAE